MSIKSKLLHIDGFGGLLAGILVLIFRNWLADLYNLPLNIVLFVGITNLVYGTYSTSLAIKNVRSYKALIFLVIANLSWTVVCVLLSYKYWNVMSIFALLHILGEGVYVALLATFEWKWRKSLIYKNYNFQDVYS